MREEEGEIREENGEIREEEGEIREEKASRSVRLLASLSLVTAQTGERVPSGFGGR